MPVSQVISRLQYTWGEFCVIVDKNRSDAYVSKLSRKLPIWPWRSPWLRIVLVRSLRSVRLDIAWLVKTVIWLAKLVGVSVSSSVRNTHFPHTLKPWHSRASVGYPALCVLTQYQQLKILARSWHIEAISIWNKRNPCFAKTSTDSQWLSLMLIATSRKARLIKHDHI